MTKERREEMKTYREKAIHVENCIKSKKAAQKSQENSNHKLSSLQRSPSQALSMQCSEADSESTMDNEYLRVSNLYRQPNAKKDRNLQLDLSPVQLQKSETFVFDVVRNTLTNSFTEEEEDLKRSTSSSSIISMVSNNINSTQNSISVPTIEINPPTPSAFKKDIDIDEGATSNPLIRSNSFTLESPSTVLLQHIHRQKNVQRRKSTATNDTIESKAKKVTRSPLMVSASIGNMSLRGKRSPYDSRSIKINRKKVVSLSKCRSSSKTAVPIDPLKNVEETHRQKFMELLKKQKEEQRELQKNFEVQQQLLMEELTKEMGANKLAKKSPVSEIDSSPTFRKSYSDSSELDKKTPRRKLFPYSPENTVVKRRVSFQ